MIVNTDELRFLCWNVAGIRSKLGDPSWLASLADYNVICFQETWDKRPEWVTVDGFASFSIPALGSMAGRARGGLLSLVALSLPCVIEPMVSHSPNLCLTYLIFGQAKMLIDNVYNSQYEKTSPSVLEDLCCILRLFFSNHKANVLIIQGDFNIHPGLVCPLLVYDYYEFLGPLVHFEHSLQGDLLYHLMGDFSLINVAEEFNEIGEGALLPIYIYI